MSKDFDTFLEEQGITRETSAPMTPQQNGLAERMMQTLKGGARALLVHSGMSEGFWAEAMATAAHVINRSPRKGLDWRTPYELLYGHVPNVSYLRIFGCRAWVLNDKATAWDPKAKAMILVGYETGSKAYRLWNPTSRSIVISAKVRFDETDLPNHPAPPKPKPASPKQQPLLASPPDVEYVDIPIFPSTDEPSSSKIKPIIPRPPSPSTSSSSSESDATTLVKPKKEPTSKSATPHDTPFPANIPLFPSSTAPEPPTSPPASSSELPKDPPRRPQRQVKRPERYGALATTELEGVSQEERDQVYLSQVQLFASSAPSGEPTTYKEAHASPDSELWIKAMTDELESLQTLGTWVVCPKPENRKVIGCKWVYRIKTDADGKVTRYKARLVAKGYSQQPGLDYGDTFAPVTRLESIRLLLGIAALNDWEIRQVDVKTAYLYGDLDEEIYMEPPPGLKVPDGHVLRLVKALYGLKQAGRQWHAKLKSTLSTYDLKQIVSDPNTYVAHKVVDGKPCILVLPVYVDDLLPMGDKVLTDEFEAHIGNSFEVTLMGDASYFLGLRISRDRGANAISLDTGGRGGHTWQVNCEFFESF